MEPLGHRVEVGLGLVRELLEGICGHPEMLELEVHNGQVIELEITAHPSDSRRIVGKRAAHYEALSQLANLLMDGAGRRVSLLPVKSPDIEGDRWEEMKPRLDWPKDRALNLLRRITDLVFAGVASQIEIVSHDRRSSRVEIYLRDIAHYEWAVHRFAGAMHTLFVPYGSQMGQVLYVNVHTGIQSNELDAGSDVPGSAGNERTAGV